MLKRYAALVLLLSGCAVVGRGSIDLPSTGGESALPIPTPTPTPTPRPIATPTPAATPSPLPGPYVVLFDWQRAGLAPESLATIDAAIRSYHEHGAARLYLRPSPGASAAAVAQYRLRVCNYLIARGVPAAVIGGAFVVQSVWPAAGTGSPGPVIRSVARPLGPVRTRSDYAGLENVPPPAVPLTAIDVWMTRGGTLTERALTALEGECIAREGTLSQECEAAAAQGAGRFAAVPEDPRREFALLLGKCIEIAGEACRRRIALEHEFRKVKLGTLGAQPRTMREKETTRFTVTIRTDTEGKPSIVAGQDISVAPPVAPEGGAVAPAGVVALPSVPAASRMCLELIAEPDDFLIEPPFRQCDNKLIGSNVAYAFKWRVTPRRAGTLNLQLSTKVFVLGEMRSYPLDSYPLSITVTARPSGWAWLDTVIKKATDTVKLTTGLAQALGALFAAVAAWAIWTLFRRAGNKNEKVDPPAPDPASAPAPLEPG